MDNILLYIAGFISTIGLVMSLKMFLGPDIPLHQSPMINAFLPPVEEENQNDDI